MPDFAIRIAGEPIRISLGPSVAEAARQAAIAVAAAASVADRAELIDAIDLDLTDYTEQRLGIDTVPALVSNPTNGRSWRIVASAAGESIVQTISFWARASNNLVVQVIDGAGAIVDSVTFATTAGQVNSFDLPDMPLVPAGGTLVVFDNFSIISSDLSGTGEAWEYKTGLNAAAGGWTSSSAEIQFYAILRAYEAERLVTAGNFAAVQTDVADGQAYRQDVIDSLKKWQPLTGTTTTGYFINANGVRQANGSFRYTTYNVTGREQAERIASGISNMGSGLNVVNYYDAPEEPTGSGTKIGQQFPGGVGAQTFDDTMLTVPENTRSIALQQGTASLPFALEIDAVAPDIEARLAAVETSGGAGGSLLVTGDSTAELSGTGIGDELAALLPSRTVYNQGVGGRLWRNNMRHRFGIEETYINVTGGVVPVSGSVACTFEDGASNVVALQSHNSYNTISQALVLGSRCRVTYVQSTNSYTIEAMDPLPTGGLTVPDGSLIKVLTGIIIESAGPGTGVIANAPELVDMLKGTIVLRTVPSINDLTGAATSAAAFDTFVGYIDDALEYFSRFTNKIAFLGLMTGEKILPVAQGGDATFNYTEAQSYERLNAIRYLNEYLRSRAPLFIDPLANHKAAADTSVFTVNGVDFDILVNTNDGLHESPTQQTRTAALIQSALEGAGW